MPIFSKGINIHDYADYWSEVKNGRKNFKLCNRKSKGVSCAQPTPLIYGGWLVLFVYVMQEGLQPYKIRSQSW